MSLAQFWDELWALALDPDDFRPFTCDGDPFTCDGDPFTCRAFVVGFNPASDVPYREFWSPVNGFDLESYKESYKRANIAAGRPPVSRTSQNICKLRTGAGGLRILITNIYAKPTKSIKGLLPDQKSVEPFKYIMTKLRPVAIILHGNETIEAFNYVYDTNIKCSGKDIKFEISNIGGIPTHIGAVYHLRRPVAGGDTAYGYGKALARVFGSQPPSSIQAGAV